MARHCKNLGLHHPTNLIKSKMPYGLHGLGCSILGILVLTTYGCKGKKKKSPDLLIWFLQFLKPLFPISGIIVLINEIFLGAIYYLVRSNHLPLSHVSSIQQLANTTADEAKFNMAVQGHNKSGRNLANW